jgi:hypothetical protein
MGFGPFVQPVQPVAGARTLRDIFTDDVRLPNVPVDDIMTALGHEGLDDVSGDEAPPPRPKWPPRSAEQDARGCRCGTMTGQRC